MPGAARFVIVFVVDGLRPDHITAEDTPTLFRLRSEGVDFTNGHAVFPTVTRVNAATIATGMQPGTHGIVGNQLYVPAVDPRRAFDTGNYRNLTSLNHARTLADRTTRRAAQCVRRSRPHFREPAVRRDRLLGARPWAGCAP